MDAKRIRKLLEILQKGTSSRNKNLNLQLQLERLTKPQITNRTMANHLHGMAYTIEFARDVKAERISL